MNLVLFFLAIFPPLFIFSIFLLNHRRLDRLIISVLLATLSHEVLLVTFPVLYSLYSNFEHESILYISVKQSDLIDVMIGETLYVFTFCLTFLLGLQLKKSWIYQRNNKIESPNFGNVSENILFAFLIFSGALSFSIQLVTMGLSISNPLFFQIEAWSSGIFFSFTPIVASCILLTKKNILSLKPKLSKLAIVCLSSIIILGILTAARGRIMWVASLLIIMGYISDNKKIIYRSFIAIIIFLPLFSFLGSYKNLAATSIISGGKSTDLAKIIYEERNTILDVVQNNNSFFYSFAERAQGPRNSVVLYNLFNQGESASYSVYLGSFFFPIPRFIWPTKPIPGSINADENNSAVFRVMDIGHNLPYMGPILASAHAYWEGGFLAIIFYGLLTGIFWILLLIFCNKLPYNLTILIVLSFTAALLIDGFLTVFSPLYAYILIFWKWVLPVLFLFFFLKILTKPTRYINPNSVKSTKLRN